MRRRKWPGSAPRRLRPLSGSCVPNSLLSGCFHPRRPTSADLTGESLDALPVLDKAGLPSAGDRMLAEPTANLLPVNTSGSTGIPASALSA